jgi:opacity protein-like surface antigen
MEQVRSWTMRKIVLVSFFVVALCLSASAQNDLAIVLGVKVTPSGTGSTSTGSSTVDVDKAFAFDATFAHDLRSVPEVALQLELPVVAVPTADISSSTLLTSKSYSSIYFTPGLRLRLGTSLPVSPWFSAGGGIAHFSPSSTTQAGSPSGASSTTKGAFQIGAGLDFKAPVLPIGVRLEVREFYAGVPNLGLPHLDLHHNIFAGGGLVFRF